MGVLKWFDKNEYKSLAEVLGVIKKELEALQPQDSSDITWSKSSNGISASLKNGSIGASDNTSSDEDDTADDDVAEYVGYFKIVSTKVSDENATIPQYKIRVVDGASYDAEKGTSDPSLYWYDGTQYQVKMWESGIVTSNFDIYVKHTIFGTGGIFIVNRTAEGTTENLKNNFIETYLAIGSVTYNATSGSVSILQRFEGINAPNFNLYPLSEYTKSSFGIRVDAAQDGTDAETGKANYKLTAYVNAGTVKINSQTYTIEETELTETSGELKLYLKVDASGDSTVITVENLENQPDDSDLVTHVYIGSVTLDSDPSNVKISQALTTDPVQMFLYQPCATGE